MPHRAFSPLAIFAALLLAAASASCASETDDSAIPTAIHVPDNEVLVASAHGVGVQVYECTGRSNDPVMLAWTLKAPQARLIAGSGEVIGKHYAGPTWEATDGSKVVGEMVVKVDTPDAVPWLLLRAKGTTGNGMLTDVTSIQRLHPTGGLAPTTGCDAQHAGKEISVPYTADYRFYSGDRASPVGLWKTFDDKTGKARGVVRIYRREGRYFGTLEQSYTPGADHRVCAVCTDERKDKPLIGLSIIRNLRREGDDYTGGDILDPESGSVYRCTLRVQPDGARLVVRGYIGFSLLGRSQTWERQ